MSSKYSKSILKSSIIFGSIQTISVLLFLIKAKFVSYYLGSSGYGIFSLYNSTVLLLTTITNFSLERSAVREITIANKTGDDKKIIEAINIILKFGLLIGLFSMVIIAIFSWLISEITFGDSNYTLYILVLSISFLFTSINSSQIAVLRGMQKFKELALTNILGSLFGIILSVVFIYNFKLEGIVPSFIFSSFSLYLTNKYFLSKYNFKREKVEKSILKAKIQSLLNFGIFLAVSSSFAIFESYLVRIYLRLTGTLNDVGYYSAGFALINSLLGIIFSMVVTEFYPKLIHQIDDKIETKKLINRQTEISLITLTPLLIILIISNDLIIPIVYTTNFLAIKNVLFWGYLGLFFKICALPLSVIFIAKGHKNVIFINEFISNVILLIIDLIFYNQWGLKGLGFSYFIYSIFTFSQILFIVYKYYSFSYTIKFYKIFCSNLFLLIISGLGYQYINGIIYFVGSVILICISIIISLFELNKVFDLSYYFNQFKNKSIETN